MIRKSVISFSVQKATFDSLVQVSPMSFKPHVEVQDVQQVGTVR